jgi:hypothetical protein
MIERKAEMGRPEVDPEDTTSADLRELKLLVPDDLHRAWQRCSWVLVSETGRSRMDIMSEMVHDFLVKHGC